jgi:opacity protein-like surface antigen
MGKKHLLMAVAVAGMTLGVASSRAADVVAEPVVEPAGWYVSLFGGASWLEDVDIEYDFEDVQDYEVNAETEVGFIVGGAIGTHVMDNLRVELEVAYSENDVDKIDYFDAGDGSRDSYDASGKFGILTFMGNVWFDIPFGEVISPYIGGGLGVAFVDGNEAYDDFDNGADIFDSSETAFAFQVGAGLRWHVAENIAIDVGYRLRGIDGVDFDNNESTGNSTSDYRADSMWSHNVIGGVSFGF